MNFPIDHDYHIHSQLSTCSSDPGQTTAAILAYAEENNFRQICLTDHYWDDAVPGASDWYKKQNFDHLKEALPLPQGEGVRFLFGCETDMDRFLTVGIPEERYEDFDFIIVPTTHLHMKGFTFLPEEDTVEKKTALYIKRFEAFLNTGLPFRKVGIAHLTCPLILREEDRYLQVLDGVSDSCFAALFRGCAERGCGIELNMSLRELEGENRDRVLRPYRIAKDCGCKFYLGSDAHHPKELKKAPERFRKIVELLELTGEDQFIL